MKGLILNNYYSVKESINLSLIILIIADTLLIMTQNPTALKLSIFLPFALLSVNAFEVLKQDSISGWNKFEPILPIERHKVVQSKYITFLLLLLLSISVTVILSVVIKLFIITPEELILNFMFRGMGFVFCLASVIYPLTYMLEENKSELIRLISMIFSIGVFCIVYLLQIMILGKTESFDIIFSISFLIVSILFFTISYVISINVYKIKEF